MQNRSSFIIQKFSTHKILVLIVIIAIALRLVTSLMLGNEVELLPAIYDQISYHTLAIRLLNGHGFTFGTPWWPITKAGEPTAHWSYIYVLFLTAVYSIFGAHPIAARIVQSVLAGIFLPFFGYCIAHRAFSLQDEKQSHFTGILSAAWLAIYPYFLYYSAALMTETFYAIGILWTLLVAFRIHQQGGASFRSWVELGLAVGITILLRQEFLAFLPFLLAWLVWLLIRENRQTKGIFGTIFRRGLTSLAIAGLCILPFTLLNYRNFHRFVLLNTNAGYAFFWSNHPIHGTHFIPLFTPDMPAYQDLIPQELRGLDEAGLDRALLQRSVAFITEDLGRFGLLTLSRVAVHFTFWPQAGSSTMSNIVRFTSFGIALPFMLLGGIAWFMDARRKRSEAGHGVLLILCILVLAGLHLISWAGTRYRLPTDGIGLLFAAFGLARLIRSWLPRAYLKLVSILQ